jgi:hypothetical protein
VSPTRTDGIVDAVITELLIPQIAAWLRKEPGLTDAQIIERYQNRRARIIAKADLFLDETKPTVTDSIERTD